MKFILHRWKWGEVGLMEGDLTCTQGATGLPAYYFAIVVWAVFHRRTWKVLMGITEKTICGVSTSREQAKWKTTTAVDIVCSVKCHGCMLWRLRVQLSLLTPKPPSPWEMASWQLYAGEHVDLGQGCSNARLLEQHWDHKNSFSQGWKQGGCSPPWIWSWNWPRERTMAPPVQSCSTKGRASPLLHLLLATGSSWSRKIIYPQP